MNGTSWALVVCVAAFLVYKIFIDRPSPDAVGAMKEAVESGALLLDVRSPGEYSGHHLEGAVNIPVGDLGARVTELTDKERTVVVYCASGGRSASAKRLLDKNGFTDVRDLGSWRNW